MLVGACGAWFRLAFAGLVMCIASGVLLFSPGAEAASDAAAQTGVERRDCVVPPDIASTRPDAGGPPSRVAVGLRLLDITKISDVNESVTVDFLVSRKWTDPRLAALAGCRVALADIWSPALALVNSGRVFPSLPERAEVGPNGAIQTFQRYNGSLSFPHTLYEFPFDRHAVGISLVPVDGASDQVTLAVDPEVSGRRDTGFTIPDWTIGAATAAIVPTQIEFLDQTVDRYDFEIAAARRSQYFVVQVIVPLTLIVIMSWMVFWISPAHFGPQIGMSATSVLTLIAFHFAMQSILPPVTYMTTLGRFIFASTVLVFVALLQSVTTSYLVGHGKEEIAFRMDRICRWLFPGIFVVMSAFVFLT